jgi:carboxylesterase type B
MVYIHGGGFVYGSSTLSLYNPMYLMDRDIVLVTLNYRLNILGK